MRLVEKTIQQFLKHFEIPGDYVFLGLSRELAYFLDILRKSALPAMPIIFADTELREPITGSLSDLIGNINDPVLSETLKQYPNITAVPLESISRDARVIVTTEAFRHEAYRRLGALGFQRDANYCFYKDALAYWSYAMHGDAYVHRVDQFVTSRCTLNCTYCNMYIPFFSEAKDRSLEQLQAEADLFFSKISRLGIFHIVGGEPLLNKSLEAYIEFLGSKYYGTRFHHFWLTSNGTVTPSQRLSELFKKYRIFVSVTDYSTVLPKIARKTHASLAVYQEQAITHVHNTAKEWIDFGDPRRDYEQSPAALAAHFKRCTAPYRGLAKDRFYFCNLSVGADESGARQAVAGDYLVLNESLNPLDLVWFDLGNVPRGYVSLCASCAGCNTGVGESVIAGASQGLRGLK